MQTVAHLGVGYCTCCYYAAKQIQARVLLIKKTNSHHEVLKIVLGGSLYRNFLPTTISSKYQVSKR